jgi:hypothetical protein
LAQGTVCKIVAQEEVKPHKVRYYLERRDPDFAEKTAEVLCVCREVKLLKKAAAAWRKNPSDTVAVISYDEKPGIQAIATTAPDLPPSAGGARGHFAGRHQFDDREGSRFGRDRHRSREFIEFLKLLDRPYPPGTAIHLILDNHSAHISRETRAWLADQPSGRFEFTFTPKHASWLNLVEGFFSKPAQQLSLSQSALRSTRPRLTHTNHHPQSLDTAT